MGEVRILFTGPPGPDSSQCGFIEVEDEEGRGLGVGIWRENPDGTWHLAIDMDAHAREVVAKWIISKGYATGHGDTVEQMLDDVMFSVVERAQEKESP